MAIVSIVCLATPTAARAQSFDKVLSSVTDLAFSWSCWNIRGALDRRAGCLEEMNGLGFELMLELPAESVFLELGLGYSEFTGFDAADDSLDLRGAVRESPSLSVYATFPLSSWLSGPLSALEPYFGIRSGLIELKHVQMQRAYPTDTVLVYNASAQTFQLGLVAGAAFPLFSSVYAFGEGAYTSRSFPSVQWAGVSGAKIDSDAPRELDFTGFSYAIGLQIKIRDLTTPRTGAASPDDIGAAAYTHSRSRR